MTISLKQAKSQTLELKQSKPQVGLQSIVVNLALLFKKYFPATSRKLSKIWHEPITTLEKAEILADATMFQRTAIILAAQRLGIFDYLNQYPETPASLIAEDLNLNPISTERLLNALESIGYLTRTPNTPVLLYKNTPITNNYLVKNSPNYLGVYYNIIDRTWSAWQSLDATIKTGFPNAKMDLFQGDKETLYHYYLFSNEYLKEPSRELFNQLSIDSVNRMIAGEVGITFIKEVLRHKPDVEFVLAGLENQIEFLDRLLTQYALPKMPEEVVASARGNALGDQWGSKEEYDLVFLFRKLAYSDYGMQFIKKSFQVLRPGGMVIVLEPTTDSLVPSPWFLRELEMMDLLIGGVKAPPLYSTHQISNLLREIGFRQTETIYTHQKSFAFVVGRKS